MTNDREPVKFDDCLLKKIHGCLAGVAIGDAYGMPMAGYLPEEVKRRYGSVNELVSPVPDHPLHGSLSKGSITDDTQLTMAIVDMILVDGKISRKGIADRVVKWVTENNLLETRLLGPSTIRAVQALIAGRDPSETGKLGTTNGGAMKIAPIGIINVARQVEDLIDDVEEVCMPTHNTGVAIAASAAVAAAVAEGLRSTSTVKTVIGAALKAARLGQKRGNQLVFPSVEKRIELAIDLINEKEPEEAASILYNYIGADIASVDAIPTAFGLFVAANGDPMTTIKITAEMGGDTDTIGAIAGAIAGAYGGIDLFPKEIVDFVDNENNLDLFIKSKKLLEFAKGYR